MADSRISTLQRELSANPGDKDIAEALDHAKSRAGLFSPREKRSYLLRYGLVNMKFQDLLRETQRGRGFRLFSGVLFGSHDKVSISIQASKSHYCSPRATLPIGDYSYEQWEIGFSRSLIDGTELDQKMDWEDPSSDWTVAGNVDSALVQELVDYLYVEYGEPNEATTDTS